MISCIALFVALAGSAFAAGLVGKNSVGSPQIINASVRNADLHDGLIGASKISPNAVTETAIADSAVSGTKVADGSLGEADLGPNSVGSSELQAGSIRASELGPMTQVTNSLSVAPNGNTYVTAAMPRGHHGRQRRRRARAPTRSTWWAPSAAATAGWPLSTAPRRATTTLTAYAYCLVGGSSN